MGISVCNIETQIEPFLGSGQERQGHFMCRHSHDNVAPNFVSTNTSWKVTVGNGNGGTP